MFHNANLILPGLWLGNAKASLDDAFLKENNITTIFNCTKDLPFHYSTKKHYRIPVDDNLKAEEIRNMELWSYEIVYKLRKEHKEGNVLVHCYAGMQRSAAVIAMYLIATEKMKSEHAINFIKEKRPIAFRPFTNFHKSIVGFEDTLNKQMSKQIIDSS